MPAPRKAALPKIDPAVDVSAEEEKLANAPNPPKANPKKAPVPTPGKAVAANVAKANPNTRHQSVAELAKGRKVLYPEVTVVRAKLPTPGYSDSDAPPLTAADAMVLLDWQTEPKGAGWGSDFLLLDGDGHKVRCLNNVNNRSWTRSWSERLAQDVVRGFWRLNGETISIGRTGLTLSAQHRLIALILAQQEVNRNPDHYRDLFPDGVVTMPALIVYGIEETEDVTRTIDNVKPRTIADCLATCGLFDQWEDGVAVSAADKKALCRATDFAIKMLWERTGAKRNAWAPLKTTSESIDFVNRHPTLLKCVRHCFQEDEAGTLAKTVGGVGAASALMFLMSAGYTDEERIKLYLAPNGDGRSESNLNLELFDQAEEFMTLVASGDAPDLEPYFARVASFTDPDSGKRPTFDELVGTTVKAWRLFVNGEVLEKADPRIKLKYKRDTFDPNLQLLDEWPTVGGIDFGPDGDPADAEADVYEEMQERADEIEAEEPLTPDVVEEEQPAGESGDVVTEADQVQEYNPGDERPDADEPISDRAVLAEIEATKESIKAENGHAGAGRDDEDAPPPPKAPPKPKAAKPGAKAPAAPLLTDEDHAQLAKLKAKMTAPKPVDKATGPVDGAPTVIKGKQPTAAETLAKQRKEDAERAAAKKANAGAGATPKPKAPKGKAAKK